MELSPRRRLCRQIRKAFSETEDEGPSPESHQAYVTEKSLVGSLNLSVPETDTGGQVEYTKALEITLVKELSKFTP